MTEKNAEVELKLLKEKQEKLIIDSRVASRKIEREVEECENDIKKKTAERKKGLRR